MTKYDLLRFTDALFYIFYILVIVRVIFSWIGIPSHKALYTVFKFSYDTTDWYLRIFRRIIPTAGAIDFSPMVGLFALFIIQRIVEGIIINL